MCVRLPVIRLTKYPPTHVKLTPIKNACPLTSYQADKKSSNKCKTDTNQKCVHLPVIKLTKHPPTNVKLTPIAAYQRYDTEYQFSRATLQIRR